MSVEHLRWVEVDTCITEKALRRRWFTVIEALLRHVRIDSPRFTPGRQSWLHAMPLAMSGAGFEWDAEKARINALKHGVTFAQATRVFGDDWLVEQLDDRGHSEHRHRALGLAGGKTLFVAFISRGDTIRLISARKATPYESTRYWKNRLLHS